jgi:hypothetical protein
MTQAEKPHMCIRIGCHLRGQPTTELECPACVSVAMKKSPRVAKFMSPRVARCKSPRMAR